jgi:hypothetical protein
VIHRGHPGVAITTGETTRTRPEAKRLKTPLRVHSRAFVEDTSMNFRLTMR